MALMRWLFPPRIRGELGATTVALARLSINQFLFRGSHWPGQMIFLLQNSLEHYRRPGRVIRFIIVVNDMHFFGFLCRFDRALRDLLQLLLWIIVIKPRRHG